MRRVLRNVAIVMFALEAILAVLLTFRLWIAYDHPFRDSLYSGIFHSVSAVCNAGFSLYSNSLTAFAGDPLFCLPIALGLIIGGLGFPVVIELVSQLKQRRALSVHSKITLFGTALLLVGSMVALVAFEWANAQTLANSDFGERTHSAVFQAVSARTAGFNTIDYAHAEPSTLLSTTIFMFIGGGSAGTAGGIKVTTFVVLLFAIIAETRGNNTVDAFGRRIPERDIRLAISVALLAVAVVVGATLFLLTLTEAPLDHVLFEVTSAAATVGLSTGLTRELPAVGQYLMIALMFVGRTGTVTLATALAMRSRRKLYSNPEEHVIVG